MSGDRVDSLSPFIQPLFKALNDQGFRYAVLRNYRGLPDYVRHDIDLVVGPESLSSIIRLILRVGEQTGWRSLGVRRGACTTVFLKNVETSRELHFDLSSGPRWYAFEFVDWGVILESRVLFNNIYVADMAAEAVVCLMLRLLYGGYVKEEYKSLIHHAIKSEDTKRQMCLLLQKWFGTKTATLIVNLAQKANWSELERRKGQFRFRLVCASVIHPMVFFRNFKHDLSCIALRFFSFRNE